MIFNDNLRSFARRRDQVSSTAISYVVSGFVGNTFYTRRKGESFNQYVLGFQLVQVRGCNQWREKVKG